MARSIKFLSAQITISAIVKRMLFGALLGFVQISVFVFGVDNANPAWPTNWRLRPLVITPLISAIGILSFYLSDVIGAKGEWPRMFLFLISAILFLIALWLGSILGLAGTMWK